MRQHHNSGIIHTNGNIEKEKTPLFLVHGRGSSQELLNSLPISCFLYISRAHSTPWPSVTKAKSALNDVHHHTSDSWHLDTSVQFIIFAYYSKIGDFVFLVGHGLGCLTESALGWINAQFEVQLSDAAKILVISLGGLTFGKFISHLCFV